MVEKPVISVTSISIKTAPSKVNYTEGDALDLRGLIVNLIQSNSSQIDVPYASFATWGINASPGNATSLSTGNNMVTITHTNSGKKVNQTIEVKAKPATPSTGGGGGGGGGGSQTSGEKNENVILRDYTLKTIVRDTETLFEFPKEGNSVISVSLTARMNGGQSKAIIEYLKGTSTQVKTAAPGEVYKNMNIGVGDGRLPELSDARISFRVEKSWLTGKRIDAEDIRMYRYNSGSWAELPTTKINEDETYVYYNAKTPGFSSFAISTFVEQQVKPGSQDVTQGKTQMSTGDKTTPGTTTPVTQEPKSSGSSIALVLLVSVSVLGVLGYRYKDQLSQVRVQLGNPDGKRYRRIKKD